MRSMLRERGRRSSIVHIPLLVARNMASSCRFKKWAIEYTPSLKSVGKPAAAIFAEAKKIFLMNDSQKKKTKDKDFPTRRTKRRKKIKMAAQAQAAFVVRDVAGCGKGLFATRGIKTGECILEEEALFVVSESASDLELHTAVESLSADARADYLSLMCGPDRPNRSHEHSICVSSCLHIGSSSQVGFFPTCARLNHSCQFNVYHSYSFNRMRKYVIACRDIARGEQLTMNMVADFLPRKQRMQLLQQEHGFVCTCAVCSLTGEALEHSENQRSIVTQLDDAIFAVIREGGYERGIHMVELRLRLMHELAQSERVMQHTQMSRSCFDAYQASARLDDRPRMLKWIKKTIQHTLLAEGGDLENTSLKKQQSYKQLLDQGERPPLP